MELWSEYNRLMKLYFAIAQCLGVAAINLTIRNDQNKTT
jgi:hypothetical protein